MIPKIVQEPRRQPLLRTLWQYRTQFRALAAAFVIFTASGMKFALAVFETTIQSEIEVKQLFTFLWFIGIALGALVAAAFAQHFSKNYIHCCSGILLLAGGITTLLLPADPFALLCSCSAEGFAYGLTLVQYFVVGGEMAHRYKRGLLLSCERIFLWFGICLQLICTRLWFLLTKNNENPVIKHPHQVHSFLVATFGLTAILLTFLCMRNIESPLLLLKQNRDAAALYVLRRLAGVDYPNVEVMYWRDDCKELLAYDNGQSTWTVFLDFNALGFFKILILRCFMAMTFSLPLNRIFLTVSWEGWECHMNCIYLLSLCGFFGSLTGALLIDRWGRNKATVFSLLMTSNFIFVSGGCLKIFDDTTILMSTIALKMAACLLLLYQLLICAGINAAISVYTSEAFTCRLKAKCIALLILTEQLFQLVLCAAVFYTNFHNVIFCFTMAGLSLLLGLLAFFSMPETKRLKLSECLYKFQ